MAWPNGGFKGTKDLNGQFSKEDTQVADKLMERCSTSFITRETQTETTRLHARQSCSRRQDEQGPEAADKLQAVHAAAGNVLLSAEHSPEVLPTVDRGVPTGSSSSAPRHLAKGQEATLQNSCRGARTAATSIRGRKCEQPQKPPSDPAWKQNVACPDDGASFCRTKERGSDMDCDAAGPGRESPF